MWWSNATVCVTSESTMFIVKKQKWPFSNMNSLVIKKTLHFLVWLFLKLEPSISEVIIQEVFPQPLYPLTPKIR